VAADHFNLQLQAEFKLKLLRAKIKLAIQSLLYICTTTTNNFYEFVGCSFDSSCISMEAWITGGLGYDLNRHWVGFRSHVVSIHRRQHPPTVLALNTANSTEQKRVPEALAIVDCLKDTYSTKTKFTSYFTIGTQSSGDQHSSGVS